MLRGLFGLMLLGCDGAWTEPAAAPAPRAATAASIAARAKSELAAWDSQNPECGPPDATSCPLPTCTESMPRLEARAKSELQELRQSSLACVGTTSAGVLVHAIEERGQGNCNEREGARHHRLVLINETARVLDHYVEPVSGCPGSTTSFAFRLWVRRREVVREAASPSGDVAYVRLTRTGFVSDESLSAKLLGDDRRRDALAKLARLEADAQIDAPAITGARREVGF